MAFVTLVATVGIDVLVPGGTPMLMVVLTTGMVPKVVVLLWERGAPLMLVSGVVLCVGITLVPVETGETGADAGACGSSPSPLVILVCVEVLMLGTLVVVLTPGLLLMLAVVLSWKTVLAELVMLGILVVLILA